jgi:hypothetical protein
VSGEYPRFDPAEILGSDDDGSVAELAEALAAARGLEALATSDGIRPTDGFEDRVMGAIATQPIPRAAARSRSAVRGGLVPAFLFTIRDAWVVATTAGRPTAVRVQALAFVILAAVAFGSLTAAGVVTVGGLLDRNLSPQPSIQPNPVVAPTPTISRATFDPTISPAPSESLDPSATAIPSPSLAPRPTATDESGGSGGSGGNAGTGGTGGTGGNPRATETLEPVETAEPTETPDSTETPSPTDDHADDGGGSGPG